MNNLKSTHDGSHKDVTPSRYYTDKTHSLCAVWRSYSPYHTSLYIHRFSSDDELVAAIKQELGVTRSSDILFNLDKTLLLVEGLADEACIRKFAEILKYDLSNYKIHVCDGDSILQVAYIFLKLEHPKIYIILDNDNKYKPDRYKETHSTYNECMRELVNQQDKCKFVGITEDGCLEDLIKDENNKFKYYNTRQQKWKISIDAINKIANRNEVCEDTLSNFEQLFNELKIPKLTNK